MGIEIPQMLDLNHKPSFCMQTQVTSDIDHLCEIVAPWDLYLNKLNRGKDFYGKADLLAADNFILYRTDFGGILEQTGSPPAGMRTFFVPEDDDQHFLWRNNVIMGNTIGLFPNGAELGATTKPGFKLYVISVPDQYLIDEAEKIGLDWMANMRPGFRHLLAVNYKTKFEIRTILSQLFRLMEITLDIHGQNMAFSSLKHKLIGLLIINYFQFQTANKLGLSNRVRIFKQFKEYITSHPAASFSSCELCAYTGASERTLQYAIKEYTQLSPNQYAKSLKLNMVREKLIKGKTDDTKINQLAIEHGFWHTPQFATDYRNHFGELPSDTLKGKKTKST